MKKRPIFLGLLALGVLGTVVILSGQYTNLRSSILGDNATICANGMTNYPDCNNGICQEGYRLQNGTCISDCAVSYVYTKEPESALPAPLTTQSAQNITSVKDSVSIDFTFTNPALESQFRLASDNVRLIYDRATRKISGKFDIAGTTYTCKPLTPAVGDDTFSGTVCNAAQGDISSCTTDSAYAMAYECSDTMYTYLLKKCIKPLTLIGTISNAAPKIGQSTVFTAKPAGGNGIYTYSWSENSSPINTTSNTLKQVYMTTGTKTVSVTVTSGTQQATYKFPTISASLYSSVLAATTDEYKNATMSAFIYGPNNSKEIKIATGSTATIRWAATGATRYVASFYGNNGCGLNNNMVLKSGSNQIGSNNNGSYTIEGTYAQEGCSTKIKYMAYNASGVAVWASVIVRFVAPNNGTPLSVTCSPKQLNINTIQWLANVSGGNGGYSYVWSGTESLNGTEAIAQRAYTSKGVKTATITVESGVETKTATCTHEITVPKPTPLSATCTYKYGTSTQPKLVYWSVAPTGGNGTYTYKWTGSESLTSTASSFSKTYSTNGTKTASVTIKSGIETFIVNCPSAPVPGTTLIRL